jgi:hypothetical protein
VARNVLLVEPNYKTKFPPLGLMKISAYHRELGDTVTFVKGIKESAAYEFWDRIYVSTLFSYHWNVTVETIKYYKNLVKGDLSRIFVGGIMASLMPKELWEATGVVPLRGVLSTPGALDRKSGLIVDRMIPDYKLFDAETQRFSTQEYDLVGDSYFGYLTRGCPNKCPFCGVPRLEPEFVEYAGAKDYIEKITELYGRKTHLVLFDNNILHSGELERIVSDLRDLGFQVGAKIAYKNKAGQTTYKQRHVDFNQGTDARLMTEENIKLLSELAIHPLRVAFDNIRFKGRYTRAVALAAKYWIVRLSNYVLYNYKDTPEDFWQRLKVNIDLNREYGLSIYSFPMKYIPLDAKDRSYVSEPSWNWQYLRNVQRVLNVLKGSVMPGDEFFYRAFGESEEEFLTILHMPEKLLMNRGRTPKQEEKEWKRKFKRLTAGQKKELLRVLCGNRTVSKLTSASSRLKSAKVREILDYYLLEPDDNPTLHLFENSELSSGQV